MPYIGKQPTVGNFQVCDAISVVNGQAAYTMQVGSANVTPETAFHMLVSLNGVLQKPGSSFTISGSTITFASNLATGDVIDFIILLGDVLNIGTPSDDTITAAKLNDTMISGLTALTSAPADTDEFIISDAGTLKRIDASLVGSSSQASTYAQTTVNQTVASASLVDLTNVTASITPSSTSSKILILGRVSGLPSSGFGLAILRGSTNIFESETASEVYPVNQAEVNPYMYIDSPSSTSSTTYKIQVKTYTGDSCVFQNSGTSNICLVEILG